MMDNRDIYQTDPVSRKLINQGVANVNDDETDQALEVLRYELETFVCDGQYEKGMIHILETYLKNIDEAQQPAVWISGFFGSGKSHLVKMLRALWMDIRFKDGATARGIATLPKSITDLFKELNVQGKRYGGLHAASGTLGASSRDNTVRMALLSIIFKSVGLPEQYQLARFVMWLKSEKIFDAVRQHVEDADYDWDEELDNLYVADGLHAALAAVKPNLFPNASSCSEVLPHQYPTVNDVSSTEMLKTIRLVLTIEKKFPLTLIVIDEVQQYIGTDSQRSIDVQEAVEACTKNVGGKLLFVGTGQTAVTGTTNLKKLEGRFTVRIELSDADVDSVVRKVILAKKPDAQKPIERLMQTNLGEISRHLTESTIGHRQDDIAHFVQDYPILPVRRRFWEHTLRVLDQTGTESQLRNQLSMVHKVIQTNVDAPLGHVVPADYLYFDSADKLLQTSALDRKIYDKIALWSHGTKDQRLTARACALVFLINKLSGSNNELGLRCTIETIADLLVEDLDKGSSALRGQLPTLLESCELLMRVQDEYRIQTEESEAWYSEFLNQTANLANESHRIESERDDRLRKTFGSLVGRLSLAHGSSRVPRSISTHFDSQLPSDADKRITVWVRDGWSDREADILVEARQAGSASPIIHVFIPERSANTLRSSIIEYKAAHGTLEKRGTPTGEEAKDARRAMETTLHNADGKIHVLIEEAFSGALVFQGGGQEVPGTDLKERVKEAAESSMQRLYPKFYMADHTGWSNVYKKSKAGAPDALKAIGFEDEPGKNEVCKAILALIAGGKKGIDIRKHFEAAPFGWPGDAIDGALQVMLVAGILRAQDERGQSVVPKGLERRTLGKLRYKVESATITTPQRIQIRKLFQKAGVATAKQGEELASVPPFLQKMSTLADNAGGEAPKPIHPDTASLDDIALAHGNEQLLALYNRRGELSQTLDSWASLSGQIEQRWPHWISLTKLKAHAKDLHNADLILSQIETIEAQRQLLADPNPMEPLIASLTQMLRDALNHAASQWDTAWEKGDASLQHDENWQQLDPDQKHGLRQPQGLVADIKPSISVDNTQAILSTLEAASLTMINDRIAALPQRFSTVLKHAAELLEPEVTFVHMPRRTLKSEADIDAWMHEAKQKLMDALTSGPVNIS